MAADTTDITAKQQLAELIFDGDLSAFVAEERAKGASWRVIAADVSARLNRRAYVSHESLRQWYGDIPPNP
jgi:hypothetical protein